MAMAVGSGMCKGRQPPVVPGSTGSHGSTGTTVGHATGVQLQAYNRKVTTLHLLHMRRSLVGVPASAGSQYSLLRPLSLA